MVIFWTANTGSILAKRNTPRNGNEIKALRAIICYGSRNAAKLSSTVRLRYCR